jgi:hypothetical protein
MTPENNPGFGDLTVFECILITLLHWYGDLSANNLGTIYGVTESYILRIIKWIAPYLGEAGDDLSILDEDLNGDRLSENIASKFTDTVHLKKAGMQADGKAWIIAADRTDARARKAAYNNKVGTSAAQAVVYSDSNGLITERTPMCMGSGTEEAHVKFWGEAGMSLTPSREDEWRQPGDMLPTLRTGMHPPSNMLKKQSQRSCAAITSQKNQGWLFGVFWQRGI